MTGALDKATVVPTLAVTDIGEARAFYGGVLGLQESDAFLSDGSDAWYHTGTGAGVYLYERPEPSGSTATACAFAVDDVRATVEELRRRGVTFEEYDLPEMGLKTVDGVARVGEVQSAWFKDPSGNILAIDDSVAVFTRRGGQQRAYEQV